MYWKYRCKSVSDVYRYSKPFGTDAIWTLVGSHFAPAPMDENTCTQFSSDSRFHALYHDLPSIHYYDNARAARSTIAASAPFKSKAKTGRTLVLILSIASTTQSAPSSHPSLSVPFLHNPTFVSILIPPRHHQPRNPRKENKKNGLLRPWSNLFQKLARRFDFWGPDVFERCCGVAVEG